MGVIGVGWERWAWKLAWAFVCVEAEETGVGVLKKRRVNIL